MRTWSYVTNPFLNATENSFLNALKISTYHDSALSASKVDPFIQELYTSFHPFHQGLKIAYDNWIVQGGKQQGESLNLKQLLQMLAHTKIQSWDIKIQNVYVQSTPEYKMLLPSRRVPFQSGKQAERIHSVKALSLAIGSDVALAVIKSDVDSFYAQLDAAHDEQKSSLSSTKSQVSEVEKARVAMCANQYANLGLLIHKFANTPEKIEQYFDLKTLRNAHQILFTGHLKGGEVFTIVKHTFTENSEIYLSNKGLAPLEFYLASAKGQGPGETVIRLDPGEQTLPANSLGKLTNTFVTVRNPDAYLTGEFEIELL